MAMGRGQRQAAALVSFQHCLHHVLACNLFSTHLLFCVAKGASHSFGRWSKSLVMMQSKLVILKVDHCEAS